MTDTVLSITKRLLSAADVQFLTINGRTKSFEDCIEKIKRKNYTSPISQLTDISGVRIVVYFEHDVDSVCKIIEKNFNVDKFNSLDRKNSLSINEVGYRSVHYVCDLGEDRTKLTEHIALAELKFEFQVRTVLQHAWAEISHDRNYKFSGKLPPTIERKLFLLAGLMEIADNGLSSLSNDIDNYTIDLHKSLDFNEELIELNAISLEEFIKKWSFDNSIKLQEIKNRDGFIELLSELQIFGINKLADLRRIIPIDFAKKCGSNYNTNIYGLVRDWMIISDASKLVQNAKIKWSISNINLYLKFLEEDDIHYIKNNFEFNDEG